MEQKRDDLGHLVTVLVIDPKHRTVQRHYIKKNNKLADLQAMVGGYLEKAATFENGDDLLVNEEGLLHGPKDFFHFGDPRASLAGTGVIVGTSVTTDGVEWVDAKTGPGEVLARVEFLTLNQLRQKLGA